MIATAPCYPTCGLRWDMIAYIKSIDGSDDNPASDTPEGWSLMQWINEEIQQRFPGKISIGESMRNNPGLFSKTEAD
jgi:1,4-alpha-glucan branching enzyme